MFQYMMSAIVESNITRKDLGKASVHSYLPYTKMIYNVDELSLYEERCRMYR